MLSFALPRRGTANTSTPTETLHPSALHIARRTLDDQQPLWHRNGHGLEASLPLTADGIILGVLVVVGAGLQPRHLRLLATVGSVIGAALRRAESYHHLVETQTHLQQVFDGLPTGLALLDSDGRLLRANPSWSRLWGLAPGVLQPQQLVPWDMFEPLLPRLPDPMEFDAFFRRWGHEPRETTFMLQRPHQELHVLLIPMHDSLGLRPSYLLAVDDVTRERELDRLKSEFISVVSHELRTPLTSILGYTELLQAREFPVNERKELVETVWKQATHLSNLVEDLLNVSRIDAGRITLSRWVLSLSQLIRELTAQLNRSLDQSRHRLLLDVSERLPPVYADRDRLRQILGNLLSNAIKYSPGGGEIVLHAEVLRTPPPGAPPLPSEPAMLISVRDPGIGIPAEELPRIFERFYRVDNSNTRKIGGTGLGLAITQALIELHGGRIWVESTPGLGSTFFFTLPLATGVLRAEN
jgi:signal transduction histidine kinase